MDTFHRVEFTGTWRRLFSRVKKHVVWGTLKSVTGMQVIQYLPGVMLNFSTFSNVRLSLDFVDLITTNLMF